MRRASRTINIPDFVKNKPKLDVALIFFWDSYHELTTERIVEGGAIPHSAIVTYSQIYNIEFESFLFIIRAMDNIVLQHQKDLLSKKHQ